MKIENKFKEILKNIPWRFFKKIAFSQIAIISLVILVFGLSARSYIKIYITNQSKNQLIESLKLIKHSINSQNINVLSWCNSLKSEWKTRYTLIDSSGKVQCDNFLNKEKLDNHLYRPEVQLALTKGIGTSIRYSSSANYEMIYGAIRLVSSTEKGSIVIRQSLALNQINLAMNELDRSILLFFVPLLFLTILISLATSLQVALPLKSLLEKISAFENLKLTPKHLGSSLNIDDEWHFVEKTLDKAEDDLAKFIEEMQLQNKKFSILMDSISDLILAIDISEQVLFMNKKYIKTFNSESTPKNKNGIKLLELTRSVEIQNIFKECISERKIVKHRNIKLITNQNKSARAWFDLTASPLVGEDGEVLGAVCSFNDISDKKLADQMREDFVTNVSHEVRTPLTAIKGYVQILEAQKETQVQPIMIEAIQKIEHNSNRLAILFQEILNLSLIESMNVLSKELIDTKDITEQVLSNLKHVHKDLDKEIITNFELDTIFADPHLLEQVLTNLIDNIYKYGLSHGLLKVTWLEGISNFNLIIEDVGPGIELKHHKRVFERFYRVDSSRSRDLGGTGLGLSIVKHIIQKHGWEIKISSNYSKGTSFTISIPKSKFT